MPSGGWWFQIELTKDNSPTITPAFAFAATYTYAVGVDGVQTISFPAISFVPACPAAFRAVLSVPALPACITWSDTGLTLTNCDYTTVGSYAVEVRKGGWIDNFTLKITCLTTSLSLATGPITMPNYTVGATAVTAVIPANAFTSIPNCGNTPTITVSNSPSGVITYTAASRTLSVSQAANNFANVGLQTFTVTAKDTVTASVINTDMIVSVSIFCQITSMTLSTSTITSPVHILATSPPQAWPGDTTIPVPTVTWIPTGCLATPTIVTIDTATSTTPSWVIAPNKISTHDVSLNNLTFNLQTKIDITTSGFILAGGGCTGCSKQINFSQLLIDCSLLSIVKTVTPTLDPYYWLNNLQVYKGTPTWKVNTVSNSASCAAYPFVATLTRTDAVTSIPAWLNSD